LLVDLPRKGNIGPAVSLVEHQCGDWQGPGRTPQLASPSALAGHHPL
jgi:hypothetical protein